MRLDDNPDYEGALVASLREAIRPGDRVAVIGGGVGVTAVIASLQAGPTGNVQCFEGSKQGVRQVQKTASRNRVSNLNVQHAVVAKSEGVWGTGMDVGEVLPASNLPRCDVLELDCEGAELQILTEMIIRPRIIIVETHGVYGAPTDVIARLLEKRGYKVSHRGLADPSEREICRNRDIQVLVGIQVGC